MGNEHVKEGPDIILPLVWSDGMDSMKGDRSQTIALHILRLFWEARGQPVHLIDGPLVARGVSHKAKRRALADLERLGLIEVERHRGQPPVARIPSHWTTAKEAYGVPWSVIAEEYNWRKK